MRILMVCLGNICRSPLAEGILRHKITQRGLNWQTDSAGTAGWHQDTPPHELSCKVAKENGFDISGQRSRPLVVEDFDRFDYLFVMDRSNYSNVKHLAGERFNPEQVKMILNEVYPGENREVPDPWSYNIDAYHSVFEMLDQACEQLIENILSAQKNNKPY
jgi:protein-tyrosine phosphatase